MSEAGVFKTLVLTLIDFGRLITKDLPKIQNLCHKRQQMITHVIFMYPDSTSEWIPTHYRYVCTKTK